MMDTEREILLADVSIDDVNLAAKEAQLSAQLERVNRELEHVTSYATKQDYALAVAAGLLAGAIDAQFVGDSPLFEGLSPHTTSQTGSHPDPTKHADTLATIIAHVLPDGVELPYDALRNGANDALLNYANTPSYVGLFATIMAQVLQQNASGGKHGTSSLMANITQDYLERMLVPAIIVGCFVWITNLPDPNIEYDGEQGVPKAVRSLALIAHENPLFPQIAKCLQAWSRELYKDLAKHAKHSSAPMSPSDAILCLSKHLNGIPELADTDLAKYLAALPAWEKLAPSSFLFSNKALRKQVVPVWLCEVFVRTCYFVLRFADAWRDYPRTHKVDWDRVSPLGNRTVERMVTVATMTLSMADTADAAIRASMEAEANILVFSQRFVARYNFVAAGRVAIAIVREAQNEPLERRLLHERRKLTESHAGLITERMRAYVEALQERLDEYIATDLQAFFEGPYG